MIVHTNHFPVAARSFVLPMVLRLREMKCSVELWLQEYPPHKDVIAQISDMVPTRLVDLDFTANPIIFFMRVSRLYCAFRSCGVKILHAHMTRSSVIPLFAGYLARVPVRVYHNHGLPYLGHAGLSGFLLRILERINLALATDVLLVSESNLRAAINDGLLTERKAIVLASGSCCGIDVEHFNPRSEVGNYFRVNCRERLGITDSRSFVVIYVGRPVRRKGFNLVLDAWRVGGFGHSGGFLIMAGIDLVDVAVAGFSGEPGIIPLGYRSNMSEIYHAADVVVLPSDHEGFPYSLLEGAACGLALIGSNVPGISCSIVHGVTGLIIQPGNRNELCSALVSLEKNRALAASMGERARERALKLFNRGRVLSYLMGFYVLRCFGKCNKYRH